MLSTIRNWAWPLRPQLVVNGQSLEDQSGTYMALINSGLIFSTRRVFKDKRTGCKLFRPKLPNVYFSLLYFSGYFIIFRLLDDTEAWVVRQNEYFHFFWRRKPFSGDSSYSLTSRPSTVSKQKKNEILDPQEMNATSTGAQFGNISHKEASWSHFKPNIFI